MAAWLRKGEIEARDVHTEPFDHAGLKAALPALRAVTLVGDPREFIAELQRICAVRGVVALFVPELSGTRLCGAARWLTPNRAIVQLSLRYRTDDHLWFTFFHELGHILLHGKRDYFVDTAGDAVDEKEREADRFAGDILIPPADYRALISERDYSAPAIERFAARIGVAPGIVIGRLQHDGLVPWQTVVNRLKTRYCFATH